MDKKLNVLVSAYACEPNKGSEPGVGWNWVKQISKYHNTCVITRENNRNSIEHALKEEKINNIKWVYFDLPPWILSRKKYKYGIYIYYYLWQLRILPIARNLHKIENFDLIHHITFGNYWLPSFLEFIPIPFIWGPVGGAESTPGAFYQTFDLNGKKYEVLRELVKWIAEQTPFVRLNAKKSVIALAKAKETAVRLSLLGAKNAKVFTESGISEQEYAELSNVPLNTEPPFRVVSIGRLIHWKGFHLGLIAFAKFLENFSNSEYWVIGNGPELENLKKLTSKLNIKDKVFFLGSLPRTKVLQSLAKCDVLLHPSLHDSGGWVCIEAMAAGRPVICLDIGGPAVQVTDETGFKISPINPEQTTSDIANALKTLILNPELLINISKKAREHILENFDWNKKGILLNKIYRKAIMSNKY